MTRLARPGLCVINTHPAANRDGDWSQGSRFYPLHRAQLAVLARVVRGAAAPAVVCGDFNVDRDSSLFGGFVTGAGLADAFEGSCPATFRAEYLPPGETPHCIDFILTADGVKARSRHGGVRRHRSRCPAARATSQTTSGCEPAWPWCRRWLTARTSSTTRSSGWVASMMTAPNRR